MTLQEAVGQLTIQRLIISDPRQKSTDGFRKAEVRPVLVQKQPRWQIVRYTEKQSFQQNIETGQLQQALIDELSDHFSQLDGFCVQGSVLIRVSKKGKILYRFKKADSGGDLVPCPACDIENQNRQKNYLLSAEDAPRPLIDLGVVTRDGKVVQSRYDKFRQINRFVEIIDEGIEPSIRHLNIIDFGCGKSYLTFVLYDYLTRVRKIEVDAVGLDLKADVIAHCNEIAGRYGYDHLHFEVGDIHGYKPQFDVDMVISLHACDTATDYALYNAISWGTKRIYSVPCCQHEINLESGKDMALSLSQYGLIKERFCALLTDSIRADLLRSEGYKVDVLEFIPLEHTPKNLMIRAIRQPSQLESAKEAQQEALQRVEETMAAYHLQGQTLYNMLQAEKRDRHKAGRDLDGQQDPAGLQTTLTYPNRK